MSVAASRPAPLLTVAIPTCNGAPHIGEALHGILTQQGVAFELVVSDDRSDDETLAVVRKLAGDRARIEVNSERLGLAGNWNRCAALARTPSVAIFHQDDVMLPGHVEAHAAALAGDDSTGLVASTAEMIDERGERVSERVVERGGLGEAERIVAPGGLAESMAAGNPFRCSAISLRVAALADVGGFNPTYRYVVDWDCWLRISRRWKVAWLPRATVQVRWHRSSETHRFRAGTADLEESARLLEELFVVDLKDRPEASRLRRLADRRLGRAFLSRAHDALPHRPAPARPRSVAPIDQAFTNRDRGDTPRPAPLLANGGGGGCSRASRATVRARTVRVWCTRSRIDIKAAMRTPPANPSGTGLCCFQVLRQLFFLGFKHLFES